MSGKARRANRAGAGEERRQRFWTVVVAALAAALIAALAADPAPPASAGATAAGAAAAPAAGPAAAPAAAAPAAPAAAAPAAAPAGQAAAAPAGQAAAAPTVMHRNVTEVEPQDRLNRRSVDTGLTVKDGYAIVWGLGYYGASGGPASSWTDDAEGNVYSPTAVHGLPQGSIVDMTAQRYDFNALDTNGCVWGWGWYGTRNGTGNVNGNGTWSTPPRKLEARNRSDVGPAADELCNIKAISSTVTAGAGIDSAGRIWSWGFSFSGGPAISPNAPSTAEGAYHAPNQYPDAQLVADLPDPNEDGAWPVQIQGGYGTFWVLMKNGDVWYFGNGDGAYTDWERAALDQPTTFSGVANKSSPAAAQKQPNMRLDLPDSQRVPVRARQSESLRPWFASVNEQEYIVQVHSGIRFGAALLSTGRIITWGKDYGSSSWAALGRECSGNANQLLACARNPDYAQFPAVAGQDGSLAAPRFVGLSCAFTACFAITSAGDLWGWGAPIRSYEVHDVLDQVVTPVRMASGVTHFQAGQGYVIWWTADGQNRGIGYNPRGSLGVHAGNYGQGGLFSETKERAVWFGGYTYRGCMNRFLADAQQRPPKDADGVWDLGGNRATLPAGWYQAGGRYYNADGVLVYEAGDYTDDKHILYQQTALGPCQDLNNPAKRFSLDTCVDRAIAKAEAAGPYQTYEPGCA
ncbi:MAG: hypothetical protein LBD90_06015 [Bifidobacteriaceae bacterium]|jgi:alpha-tubulin suppressor-like RCC1 family protein|nr:hypothetical protein [Bifidobacteriaceae bacterium]